MVLWLRLHAFSARGSGLIPGWGFKISQARLVQKKKKKSKDKGCDVSFVLLAFFSENFKLSEKLQESYSEYCYHSLRVTSCICFISFRAEAHVNTHI